MLSKIDLSEQSNYNVIMLARLIKIGNSQGIRIPKSFIEQCGLKDEVELTIQDGGLIIKPKGVPRAGWEESFKQALQDQEDAILLEKLSNDWDEEWEW